MKNKCLSKLARNASRKLKPQILIAIESFVNNEIYEINANMVRDRCISMNSNVKWSKNSNVDWSERIPAICNGMRNTLACGAIIVGEDRDFGGFTIRFGVGNTPAFDTSNSHKPPNKSLKESNKTRNKSKKSKMTQVEFIDNLVDTLHVFSPDGRKRILQYLTTCESQLLCLGGKRNGQLLKPIKEFGEPNRILIENRIIEKYPESTYIDDGIKWNLTFGASFNLKETKKSVKLIICFLSELYKKNKYKVFVEILLNQLKGNNTSLLRLLSQPKYKSKSPGSALKGKQTKSSNKNNLGFTLEHTIPADFLEKKLLEIIASNTVEAELDFIMSKLFSVWLNTDDDNLLTKEGLKYKMPPDWTWENDPLERYWKAGIDKNSIEEYRPPDTVFMFLEEENFTHDTKKEMLLPDLYNLYKEYCGVCGFKGCIKKTFENRLRSLNYSVIRKSQGNMVGVSKKS